MRGLLGAASLVFALLGLLAAASWEMEFALILLAFAGACLLPVWLRGPRRLDVGALLHLALLCVFVIGNLVCIHLLIAHRGIEWDLTSNRRNSFSPLTEQQLRALPGDVEITAVVTDASEMRPLLERLSALTPRVSFRLLHFIRDWHEVISLAEERGITEPGPGTMLFSCQVNERTVRQTILRAGDGPEFEFDEQAWVNACIEVTRERSPQVFFTLNHGERDLGAELRGAREIFASLGFEVTFGALRDLTDDVDLIVIVGPQRDFDESDLALLEDSLEAGVGALLLLDPPQVIGSERLRTPIPLTRLEAWVEANGIDLPEGVIAEDDPEMENFSGGRSPRVRSANATHPVTESVNPTNTLLVLHEARPLAVGFHDQQIEREIESLLVTTRRHTWLTSVIEDPNEASAPPQDSLDRREFHVAAAVTRFQPAGSGTSRLVVVGDSDWLTDRFLQLPVLRESAERLLRGAVGWLVEAEDLIAIPPRTPPQTPIMLTGPQQRFASAVAVILLPELLLALGVGLMLLRDRPERRQVTPPVVWGIAAPLLAFAGAVSLGFGMPLVGGLLLAAGLIALLIFAFQSPPVGARIAVALTALVLGLALAVVWSIPALRSAGEALIAVHPITARSLAALERDVTALTIGEVPEMLTRLQQCSPRIRIEALDPMADGERITTLGLEHGFRLMEGDTLLIGGDDLLHGSRTAKLVPQRADEQRWANALMDIGARRPIRALLTEGHGEWSLRSDMTKLREIFGQLAIATEQAPLRRDSQVDFIMIAGPSEDFTPSELEILDRHVDQGGGLLVFLDPPSTAWIRSGGITTAAQEPEALSRWLEDRWALTLAPGLVVDDDPQLIETGFGNVSPLISGFSEHHPISQRVVQQIAEAAADPNQSELQAALMLTEARPVGFPLTPPPQSIDREFLFATRQHTWLESDIDTLIQQGEIAPEGATRQTLPLGAAVQLHRANRSAHLVMIGDSDCLTDAQHQSLVESNISARPLLQLLRSAVGWVTPENRRVFLADPEQRVPLQIDPQAAATQRLARAALTVSILLLIGGLASLVWRREGRPRLSPLILGMAAALLLTLWSSAPTGPPIDISDEISLISLPPGDVISLSIERDDHTLTFERREGRWEIVGGFELPAAEEGVDLLLRALAHRARSSAQAITPRTDLASLGLTSPQARLTLGDRRGRTETLLLGLPPLQSFRRVWAQIEGEPTVFTADTDILTMALRPLGRWEDES